MNETVISGSCPSCGAAREHDSRFCVMCGARVPVIDVAATLVMPRQVAVPAQVEVSPPSTSVLPGLARLLLLLAVTLAGLVVWRAIVGSAVPGFQSVLDFKITLSTAVLLLAILQPITAASLYGWLRLPVISADAAAFVHRWSGRVLVVAGAIVAFYCVKDIGPQSTPTRVALHSVLGSAVFVVLVAKLIVLRGIPRLHPLLPVLGFALSLLFAGVWATSAFYMLR